MADAPPPQSDWERQLAEQAALLEGLQAREALAAQAQGHLRTKLNVARAQAELEDARLRRAAAQVRPATVPAAAAPPVDGCPLLSCSHSRLCSPLCLPSPPAAVPERAGRRCGAGRPGPGQEPGGPAPLAAAHRAAQGAPVFRARGRRPLPPLHRAAAPAVRAGGGGQARSAGPGRRAGRPGGGAGRAHARAGGRDRRPAGRSAAPARGGGRA